MFQQTICSEGKKIFDRPPQRGNKPIYLCHNYRVGVYFYTVIFCMEGGDVARLTEKQKRFVAEYLVDLNATQAAIRAGYSEKTAEQIGYQLLQKTSVQAAIQEAQDERSKRTEITQDMVVNELVKVAFANGADYARVVSLPGSDGRQGAQTVELTDTDTLTADQKAAISSIEETRFGIKVSTYDKVRALELLGKHLGMFTDRVEHSGETGLRIELAPGVKELAE